MKKSDNSPINITGLPHGQEKSGKTKKNDKRQVEMGVGKNLKKTTIRIVICVFKYIKII